MGSHHGHGEERGDGGTGGGKKQHAERERKGREVKSCTEMNEGAVKPVVYTSYLSGFAAVGAYS